MTSFFGCIVLTTALLEANAPVTISFLGTTLGRTGSGIRAILSSNRGGSILGGSERGTTIFGGVSFASTVGDGGMILGTGVLTTGGVYKSVTWDARRGCIWAAGSHFAAFTSSTMATAWATALQAKRALRRAGGSSY